ncbi:hypothetical protein PAT3040_06372 [Paenibacillus agaridevorans]|uniref:Uncharacterized protein n=1 Tax=Paenibacillus agaridevorans TaxID=171404 RepID=A0A2R5F0R8_9BACL|nr:hypothetical protein PAT3040_06372 [Paenibacillus agaridevorans]
MLRVRLELPGRMALTVRRAQPDLLAQTGLQELLARMVLPGQPDQRALLAPTVPLDQQELLALLALMVRRAQQDLLAPTVLQEPLELRELLALMARLEQPGLRERRALMA